MRTEKVLREQIADLEDTIYDLKEEIFFLKKAIIVPLPIPREWNMTKIHTAFIELLHTSKGIVTYNLVFHIVYGDRVSPPGIFTIHSHICKIRNKLKQYNIQIIAVRGEGFVMPIESKKTLTRLIEESLKLETQLAKVNRK